jgi:sugar/nucleoside kinase (ribokinase family)
LLKLGRKHGAFNTASFTSEEAISVLRNGAIRNMDLLSINMDEATAVASLPSGSNPKRILKACVKKLTSLQPDITLFVTHGANGAYGFCDGKEGFVPGLKVNAVNTAGGGDAFLAGLILGKLRGLPWLGERGCLRLARLISAMSTVSPDTIHFGINKRSLKLFAERYGEGKVIRALD